MTLEHSVFAFSQTHLCARQASRDRARKGVSGLRQHLSDVEGHPICAVLDFIGDFSTHYGIFAGCGTSIPFDTGGGSGTEKLLLRKRRGRLGPRFFDWHLRPSRSHCKRWWVPHRYFDERTRGDKFNGERMAVAEE